ncbi:HNH endonuclease [Prosthecobacter sp.]|uniref:HNH endonuclease n=1 Tax=Prosthecobacter sp. TaxID=1965333 RepID=UPI003783F871
MSRLAQGLCEYCRCPERYSSSTYSIEHITPQSKGGSDDVSNLAFACQGCNNRKFIATAHPDPHTGEISGLFHPRQDRWAEHFIWSPDHLELVGTTAIGRASIERMALNRGNVVSLRRVLANAGVHPPKTVG